MAHPQIDAGGNHPHLAGVNLGPEAVEEPSWRLREAIVRNMLATVGVILDRHPGLLTNPDPANGWTSLHYAAYHGHYHICQLLISQGHDRHEVSLSHNRSTALHLAASQNHEHALHYLAQHIQRSMDWRNAEYKTALMVAVEEGHDPCVNLLLDFGADIELADASGSRPLHIAAARGHVKIIRTLVDRGADGSTPNAEGWTPADYGSTLKVEAYLRTLLGDVPNISFAGQSQQPSTPTHNHENRMSIRSQVSPTRTAY